MAKQDQFNKGRGPYVDKDAGLVRHEAPYEQTNPARPIWRNVDKNQAVNDGASGAIPYGTDK